MAKQMIMGNQAIALGALKAGVNLVAGYPGTPSSEIIEFISKYKSKTGTYVEWSVNEKAAAEVAAGASYAGSRTLITMKQVGLNVASDPVMCLSYVGVKGGMVIVSADDPGPISSQTEQDTRNFAQYSKLPCFDPSTPLEAYEMIQEAFELSEKYNTPVLLRPTTRVDHAYESMEFPELVPCRKPGEFEKDSKRWVIFPRASYLNHKRIFERNEKTLPKEFSESKWNYIKVGESLPLGCTSSQPTPSSGGHPRNAPVAFAVGGISYCYLMEALSILGIKDIPVLKIGNPYPFPKPLAEEFLKSHEQIVVFEELDPVIEENLIKIAGYARVNCQIRGKLDGTVPEAGELSVEIISEIIKNLLNDKGNAVSRSETAGTGATNSSQTENSTPVPLPVRPPVLCAGCPHRGSFYAVKQAMKGKKTVYCGDIGCYTLGNAMPLDMTDTCLCMGADITMAQGFYHNEPDRHCFSFIGDSTFFASGITGVVNAVYNQAKQTICILDNSTTAMTGHQPHPGTGMTMMGEIVEKISIEKILEGIGVSPIIQVNPFDQKAAVEAVQKASEAPGVSAIIFKAPCIAIAQKVGWEKPHALTVNADKCIGCRKCINELGCPALSVSTKTNAKGKQLVEIDKSLCTGCSLCSQVCPTGAIK
ncbi:indolepyruvate ferredoxin oxidoreductase alpha subunit [Treponema bryantii]|uniref:Indolepyruvate oxidoreductase subunit IorA n=1 Tax=Treponema bryantii TaxID=163 RepID=A0A1H9DDH3_9SPIR|nr:indolepyruvate ferredoxin oxidoreductase subunit alpha [Treponema bryantii]SEQ11514.1 indolepyruvate ferredoxin oxidoreductase alpha subunit [Treponema bryantii]